MKDLKIYEILRKLSVELFSNSGALVLNYKKCWDKVPEISSSVSSDIESIFGKKNFISSVRFILNDPNHRQSASCCVLDIKFAEDNEFILFVECLIDHSRVMIKITSEPSNREFDFIARDIKEKYNSEFLTELKDLTE